MSRVPGILGLVFLVVSPEINVDHVTANANRLLDLSDAISNRRCQRM